MSKFVIILTSLFLLLGIDGRAQNYFNLISDSVIYKNQVKKCSFKSESNLSSFNQEFSNGLHRIYNQAGTATSDSYQFKESPFSKKIYNNSSKISIDTVVSNHDKEMFEVYFQVDSITFRIESYSHKKLFRLYEHMSLAEDDILVYDYVYSKKNQLKKIWISTIRSSRITSTTEIVFLSNGLIGEILTDLKHRKDTPKYHLKAYYEYYD